MSDPEIQAEIGEEMPFRLAPHDLGSGFRADLRGGAEGWS